jgi:hypothetical protein
LHLGLFCDGGLCSLKAFLEFLLSFSPMEELKLKVKVLLV